MPDDSSYCPACGRTAAEGTPAMGKIGGIRDNVAAALAYLFLPALVFILVQPFKRNQLIRFHSFQSLLLLATAIVIGVALLFMPFLNQLFVLLLGLIFGMGFAVLWAVMVIKALQGEWFKLPWVGSLAERLSISTDGITSNKTLPTS